MKQGDQGPPEHAQGNGPPASPPAAREAPAPPRGNANGHARQAGGQAQVGAQPEAPGQAKARGHGKTDTGSGGSAPKQHGNAGSEQQGSSHANAGKVTLCHATGSATNPYVEITISANALAAHERHQDGRDLYPAPAGGCPGGSSQPGGGEGGQGKEHGKVTICHATGSETNPYVLITVDEHALKAHTSHQDGQDIVNPSGPCPGATIPSGVGNPPSGIVSPGGELAGASPPADGQQPAEGVLGVSEQGGGGSGGAPETENAVLGANQGSGPENAVQASGDSGTSLPFTGLQLLVMAALGLVLGVAGFRLRRSAA